jgi:hypothetical protein
VIRHLKKLAAVVLVAMIPGFASANVISTSDTLTAGDIGYFTFNVTDAGTFTLDLTGVFDTELFLFDGAPSLFTFIAANDDVSYPSNLNSRIVASLGIGQYVAAIGAYNTSLWDAISGTNWGNTYHGAYTLTVSSRDGYATGGSAHAVPEPGTVGLLGAGLIALALMRRRKGPHSA